MVFSYLLCDQRMLQCDREAGGAPYKKEALLGVLNREWALNRGNTVGFS